MPSYSNRILVWGRSIIKQNGYYSIDIIETGHKPVVSNYNFEILK
jgi:hypothetical protein